MSSFVLPESPHWAVGFVWRKTLWMEDMTTTGFGTPSASRSGFGCFCSTPTHSVKAIQKPSANAFGCFRWDRRKIWWTYDKIYKPLQFKLDTKTRPHQSRNVGWSGSGFKTLGFVVCSERLGWGFRLQDLTSCSVFDNSKGWRNTVYFIVIISISYPHISLLQFWMVLGFKKKIDNELQVSCYIWGWQV